MTNLLVAVLLAYFLVNAWFAYSYRRYRHTRLTTLEMLGLDQQPAWLQGLVLSYSLRDSLFFAALALACAWVLTAFLDRLLFEWAPRELISLLISLADLLSRRPRLIWVGTVICVALFVLAFIPYIRSVRGLLVFQQQPLGFWTKPAFLTLWKKLKRMDSAAASDNRRRSLLSVIYPTGLVAAGMIHGWRFVTLAAASVALGIVPSVLLLDWSSVLVLAHRADAHTVARDHQRRVALQNNLRHKGCSKLSPVSIHELSSDVATSVLQNVTWAELSRDSLDTQRAQLARWNIRAAFRLPGDASVSPEVRSDLTPLGESIAALIGKYCGASATQQVPPGSATTARASLTPWQQHLGSLWALLSAPKIHASARDLRSHAETALAPSPSPASRPHLAEALELAVLEVLTDVSQGAAVDAAVSRVRTKPLSITVRQRIAVGASVRGGSSFIRSREDRDVDYSQLSAATDAIIRLLQARAPTQAVADSQLGALGNYDFHFPPNENVFYRTFLGEYLLPEGSQDPMPRAGLHGPWLTSVYAAPPERPRLAASESPLTKIMRAPLFSQLIGSNLVGGVLLGAPQNPGEPVNDFDWAVTDGKVKLYFRTSQPNRHELFSQVSREEGFDRDIIHQALGYVADGRLVAVTMQTGRPLTDYWRIMLHPSLQDSQLGNEISTLDTFVDYVLDGDHIAENLLSQVQSDNDLYQFSYHTVTGERLDQQIRSLELLDRLGERLPSEQRRLLDTRLQKTRSYQERFTRALLAWKKTSQPSDSILKRKPEYFSPALVGQIESCAGKTDTIEGYSKCLANSSVRPLWKPPGVEAWSQVRELGSESPQVQAWPFRFLKQLTFSGPTGNGESDLAPYEFSTLSDRIVSSIRTKTELEKVVRNFTKVPVNSSSEWGHIIDRATDFTVAQRWFRMGLEGKFGPGFPVEKLATLARATAGGVRFSPTTKWSLVYRPSGETRQSDHDDQDLREPLKSLQSALRLPKRVQVSDLPPR